MGIDIVERERRKPWARWNDGDVRGRKSAPNANMKDKPMNRDDLFPSKYLKAADVGEHAPKSVIRLVQLEELGTEREKKAVVYFRDNPKGLVLNKTNFNSLAGICGSDDTDDWPGAEVQLCTELVAFRGQTAPAIRVRQPATVPQLTTPTKRPSRVTAPVHSVSDELSDEIPF